MSKNNRNHIKKKNERKERKKTIKKRRLRLLFLIIIIPIIIYISFYSNFFKLKNIEVTGNEILLKDDIINKSGLKKSQLLFNISNRKIEKNLEELNYVDYTNVSKKWPNTVKIKMNERERFVQFKLKEKYLIISDDGIALEFLNSQDENLLKIEGIQLEDVKLGKSIFNGENKNLQTLLNMLLKSKLLNKIEYIDINDLEDVKIHMENDLIVDYGLMADIEYKTKLLNEVIIDIEDKGLNCYRIQMNKGKNPIVLIEDGKIEEE